MKLRLMLLAGMLVLGWFVAGRGGDSVRGQTDFAPPHTSRPDEPLPGGAVIQTVVPALDQPITMAFDPTGRIFFTQKGGQVRLVVGGVLQATSVITFTVDDCSERGLLGLALDPNFSSNHYVYVYYTAAVANCGTTTNNVARFVESNGVGSNPTILFSSPQEAGNHNGGNIHFGPDGKLYVTIGDNDNAANSQDVTVKNGKIHRLNPDGSPAPGNPVFTQTGALPSLYAMGVRNSFDFTFDPLSPYIFASENGPTCDDEMNRIVGGYNYGWRSGYPCDDEAAGGPDPTFNTIAPLWFLPGAQCCVAPTGIEVYRGTSIPSWTNALFMCSYGTNMYHFYLNANRTQVTSVATVDGVTCGTDLVTGTDGALYYFESNGYNTGDLKRIVGGGPTATPIPPVPTITPGGPTPCPIQFTDVAPGSTFYEVIRCLACRGILSGYPCGGPGEPCPGAYFRPGNNVTRGQVAKIVANSAGWADPVPSGQQTFADVAPTSTFWLWVERVASRGIISGYPCGGAGEPCVAPGNRPYYRPNNAVTRGQLAKIDASAATYTETPTGQTFQDVAPGSTFWLWVERVASRGIISGYPCGGAGEPCVAPGNRPYYRPNAIVTRSQTAKIVATTFYPSCQTPARR